MAWWDGQSVAIVLGAAVVAFGWSILVTWPGIRRLRLAADAHWSEQARVVHPYRGAAGIVAGYVPAVMVLGVLIAADPGPWMIVAVACAASAGAVLGAFPITRAVQPGFSWREWPVALRFWQHPMLLVWVMAMAMPPQMGPMAWAGVGLLGLWISATNLWPVRLAFPRSHLAPAPADLLERARNLARAAGAPLHGLFLVRKGFMNAVAFPISRQVALSEELVRTLPPAELDSILCHELAHLRESRWVTLARLAAGYSHLVLLFLKPATAAFGAVALGPLVLIWVLVPMAFGRWARSLERKADAQASRVDPATYASALLTLHRLALIPAVVERPGSHPDLYDRLLACGITPDFPRPKPANVLTLGGALTSAALGILLMVALQGWLARGMP